MVRRSVTSGATAVEIMILLVLSALAVAAALPSYIAVPADQIAFVDLTDLRVRRVPRQTLAPPPPPQQQQYIYNAQQLQEYPQQAVAPAPRAVTAASSDASGAATHEGISQYAPANRPPDFGEYVDFGAHTGNNGAFGWYADYPINQNDDSYRK